MIYRCMYVCITDEEGPRKTYRDCSAVSYCIVFFSKDKNRPTSSIVAETISSPFGFVVVAVLLSSSKIDLIS